MLQRNEGICGVLCETNLEEDLTHEEKCPIITRVVLAALPAAAVYRLFGFHAKNVDYDADVDVVVPIAHVE